MATASLGRPPSPRKVLPTGGGDRAASSGFVRGGAALVSAVVMALGAREGRMVAADDGAGREAGGPAAPSPAAAFDPAAAARALLAAAGDGALGTIGTGGGPFVSQVAVAPEPGGDVVLLVSALAVHSRNLEADDRAALLLVAAPARDGTAPADVLAGSRLTLEGRVVPAPEAAAREAYVARHPEAAAYADFADFTFRRLVVERGHLVAGFGRIASLSRDEMQDAH